MRNFLTLVLAVAGLMPASLGAQSIFDLLQSVRSGGGWVEIPIRGGRGTLLTGVVPTAGLTLQGCLQVYAGHTGRWEVRAQDRLGNGSMDVTVGPGEPSRFSYRTGARSQLGVEVRWSEPRDTTLMLWVGLESPLLPRRDACAPSYTGQAGTGTAR